MSLNQLEIEIVQRALPAPITDFLKEADKRCDEFFDTGANKTIPRFIPADYAFVYSALHKLREDSLIEGDFFCEWGSGLGAAACLATLMGFDSIGIEIQPALVARAKQLARDHALSTHFIENSFLPTGYEILPAQGANELIRPTSRKTLPSAYPEVDWTLEEVDLFYVYPWPEEQEAALELFDEVAGDGALLLAYFGEKDVCVYRKE